MLTLHLGIPPIAGLASDFAAHDESLDAARRQPGFFTLVATVDDAPVGYAVWRVVGPHLEAWPCRSWGACRHAARKGLRVAMEWGRRQGALVLIDRTHLRPAVFARWLGVRPEYVGDVWRADG